MAGMSIQYGSYRGKPTNLPYYAMTHNWDLVITDVPTPLATMAKGLLESTGAINASCISVSNLPNSNLNEGILTGNIRGIPFHQAAGRESSVREMNFVLYEYSDYSLFKFFECWKGMAVNRFDFSQNLDAMVSNGIQVIMTDTDRKTPMLTYDLFDTVCTKCSINQNFGSEPELIKVNVSLKCGYYNISKSGVASIVMDTPFGADAI